MTPTKRHSLAAVLLSAVLVALFAAPSAASDRDDLERQKNQLNSQLGSAKASFDEASKEALEAAKVLAESQGKLDSANGKLNATRGELSVARARDAQMQAELEAAEAALVKAERDLANGIAALEKAEQAVADFTVESLQEGDPGMAAFSGLLSGGDPNEFVERMSANTAVADAQLAKMQEMAAARVMLGIQRDNVEKLRDEIKVKRAEAAANLVRMQELEAQAVQQQQEVAALVAVNTQNRNKANAIRDAEASKVAALEADRRRTEQMIRDLIARQSANPASVGGDGGPLDYPIPGARVTSPYGMRVHPVTGVYKLHDGTDFGAACGTPIRASASGTVIGAYFNAGYGNRVLVAHGAINGTNIVTTYNHLSRYAVGNGQHVTRGQVVGYVGSTGYSTGCHLHFMVIANGNTVNPMNWL